MRIDQLSPAQQASIAREVRRIVGKTSPDQWTKDHLKKIREFFDDAGLMNVR